MNKPIKGDKVSFWLTVQGKPKLITGELKGYNSFNGCAVVQSMSGYTHYVKPDKLTVLPKNEQKLDL